MIIEYEPLCLGYIINEDEHFKITYSSAYTNQWVLMFENGLIEATDNEIALYHPTKSFDNQGNFIKPKKKLSLKISKDDYAKSLELSVKYFLTKVKNKSNFNIQDFKKSISSNQFLFS